MTFASRPLRTFQRGELMLHAGRAADCTFLIRQGVVRCFLLDDHGRETTTTILGHGQIVGIAPWLGHTAHREFAEALTHVEASSLGADELPHLHGLALGCLAQRLELTLGVLKSVSLVPAKLRAVDVHQRLSILLGSKSSSALKGTTVASLLQMRPETLARAKHGPRPITPATQACAQRFLPGSYTFGAGDILAHDDLPAGYVGHVVSGELEVSLIGHAQRAVIAETLEAGDLFSLGALLGLPPVGVKLVGIAPGRIEILPATELLHWLQDHPTQCGALVTRLGQRLEQLENALVRASTRTVREHLMLVLRSGPPGRRGEPMRTWSHQVLAQHLGVCRESVTRNLASLEMAGLIRRDGRRIELVEPIPRPKERPSMQQLVSERTNVASCRLCGLRSSGPLCGGCAERLEFDLQLDRRRACPKCGRHVELCEVLPCDKQVTAKSNTSQKPALVWLPVDAIDEPPAAQNSRQVYTDKAIRELADSLRQDGVLQPICVRPKGSRYEVVFGIRRLRAAKQAGIPEIPASVRMADDHRAFLLNVLENLHREQLSNTERVRTIERLAATGLGVREISRRTGFNPSTISRWLRINGRAELKQALADGRIDIARAVMLVEAPREAVPELLRIAPTVSVAELRLRVASLKTGARHEPNADARRQLQDALQSLRAVKVAGDRQLLDSIRRELDRLAAQA